MAIGQDLLNVPMGDMIREMAFAIADAQFELDQSSLHAAQMMSGTEPSGKLDEKFRIQFGPDGKLSMLELGFTPTFYQFVDTWIEVRISVNMQRSEHRTERQGSKSVGIKWSRSGFWESGLSVVVSHVDATYSAKYNYSAEGSSVLRTKIVPVPPPAILEERARQLLSGAAREYVVPDLKGQTVKEAKELLDTRGIPFEDLPATIKETTKIKNQDPNPGELLVPPKKVTFTTT